MNETMQLHPIAEWYDTLVSDCHTIIDKAKIETGIRLLKAKWELGNRILPEYEVLSSGKAKTLDNFAKDMETAKQRVAEWIQFRKFVGEDFTLWVKEEFGDSLSDASDKVPSWRKIVHEWLVVKKEKQQVEFLPLPSGVFNVIYADPPWSFKNGTDFSPEQHYPVLPIEEIKNFGVLLNAHIAKDAILFLWTPNGILPEALDVLEAWGFKYKTNYVWLKEKPLMGYWSKSQHELLLVATKGEFKTPNEEVKPKSVQFTIEELEHSQKPEIFYPLIETMFPQAKRLELFARNSRDGWASWGNEVGEQS